jgi:ribosomal protein S26
MSTTGCAQCGRELPNDAAALARWKNRSLTATGEFDETTAAMLLCPECAEDDRLGEYEEGEAG